MKKILDTQKVSLYGLVDFIKVAHNLGYSVEVEAVSAIDEVSVLRPHYMVSLVKFEKEETEQYAND